MITVQAAQPQTVTTTPSATAGHVAVTTAVPQQLAQLQHPQQVQINGQQVQVQHLAQVQQPQPAATLQVGSI